MDFLPENLQTLLQHPSINYLRTSTQAQVTTHLANLRTAYVQPCLIEPLSSFLASTASWSTAAMPDLVTVVLLGVLLLISLRILDYARRLIMFWVVLALRLVFWGTLLGFAWYVYRVGVENAGRDLGWLWGIVLGFVEDFQARSAAAAANANANANAANAGSGPGVGAAWGAGRGANRGSSWGW
ncbi:Nuclear pore assembly and biogenesis protein APQ12 [Penicillium alfredii]|uniref:Nuclear pore assembly and biogenesis protein APQ12 n=1 Tax=Penicillium alfredii TaxID=1506179 RepID=A0A9W9F1N3_9EURO|nr:Nuclear pore assembly and biogenesis protein APQ12 [Penicillium alfredii]KAJ5091826.1 Nuclear pore assembly and biogenesis protein APQ12 [Penicillium alfredii]